MLGAILAPNFHGSPWVCGSGGSSRPRCPDRRVARGQRGSARGQRGSARVSAGSAHPRAPETARPPETGCSGWAISPSKATRPLKPSRRAPRLSILPFPAPGPRPKRPRNRDTVQDRRDREAVSSDVEATASYRGQLPPITPWPPAPEARPLLSSTTARNSHLAGDRSRSAEITRVIDVDRWQIPHLFLGEVQSNDHADAFHRADWNGDRLLAP
jgi:hypothetical protein